MKRWFNKYRTWILLPAMINLGMLFFVAGLSKLLYRSSSFEAAPFIEALPGFNVMYQILPYAEMVIGLLLIHGIFIKFAGTMAGGFALLFAISNIIMINMGKGLDMCGCYGMAGRMTYLDAMIVDGIIAVLVAMVFLCYRGKWFNKKPWFINDDNNEHNLQGLEVDMLIPNMETINEKRR